VPRNDLFSAEPKPEQPPAADLSSHQPLAARMRPRTLDEFVGQIHILGPGQLLRRAIEADRIQSLIFYGPPGTGKTSLAQIIARQTKSKFERLSGAESNVADMRRVLSAAANRLENSGQPTILFIDEIHRFNKAQQDAVLPYVEDGTVTLIGATTENPSFEVNSALLSRSRVFVLTALDDDHIRTLLERALSDPERGLGAAGVAIVPAALDALVNLSNGDARVALGTLEFAAAAAPSDAAGSPTIDEATVAEALQKRARTYDKGGDAHYDTISAFIKTVRGSDPDAAVYYLARMIESGEDALFIARRLVILASEDIGLADRHALPLAIAAQQAVHFIGLPEGFYPLAHATIYLATAPKSNTVGRSYGAALADVAQTRNDPVPLHLRNAPTNLMRKLGYGSGYKYAHTEYAAMDAQGDGPPPVVLQSNLPEALAGRRYFDPTRQGDEARLRAWIDERRNAPR
jgi:putative ATPase